MSESEDADRETRKLLMKALQLINQQDLASAESVLQDALAICRIKKDPLTVEVYRQLSQIVDTQNRVEEAKALRVIADAIERSLDDDEN